MKKNIACIGFFVTVIFSVAIAQEKIRTKASFNRGWKFYLGEVDTLTK